MVENKPSGPNFSETVLNQTPGRVLKFVSYIGRTPSVFAVMKNAGFTQTDMNEAWELLHGTGGYVPDAPSPVRDQKAASALAELDAWDEPNFRRFRAAIRRVHPNFESVLFAGIEPGTGSAAILSVSTFLDRVDKLKDANVLRTLEQRGLTPKARADLRELISIAKGVNEPEEEPTNPKVLERRHQQLVSLKLWFDDWAETARTAKLSRYHLINLGLATRKKTVETEEEEDA